MKVFFDASVIIAALLSPTGGSSQLFKYIKAKVISGFSSETVITEIMEEKKYEKLQKTEKEIEQYISNSGLIIREYISEEEIKPYKSQIDSEDAHLIAGANQTQCQYLVSLDKKHVLKDEIKKRFLPLKIVSPKELLDEIVEQN